MELFCNPQGHLFSIEAFKTPQNEYAPTFAWSWNEPVTREGIDKQLCEFFEVGIRSLYILPLPKDFRPTLMATTLSPEYLSKDFFDLVSYAIRKAKDMGMTLWLYDEGGWPSGGACGNTYKQNKDAATDVLHKREIALSAGECYHAGEGTIATFLGKTRIFDGYKAEKNVSLTEFYTVTTVSGPNLIDNLTPSVIETFIENTYEAYAKAVGDLFGGNVKMIFTDEPMQLAHSIPKGLFDIFYKEYGYDLRDHLYAVLDAYSDDPEIHCVRIDYVRLLGKMFREICFGRISNWCEEHGVCFGGHLNLEHVPNGGARMSYFSALDCLRKFHVPGIDVIWDQIWYPYDETTPVPEGSLFFPRIAPSAARQMGRNLALTETGSVSSESFYPEVLRYVIHYQAVRGINVFNLMALPYGRKNLSALVFRPMYCPEKPGFYHLSAVNEYLSRLAYLTRLGEAVGDTALYHPSADFCASSMHSTLAARAYNCEGAILEDKHVWFDLIDDEGIRAAKETAAGLALGNAVYKHIVVPKCEYMPKDVAKKIEKYIGEGEPLLPLHDPEIRVMIRILGEDALWFFFNGKAECAKDRVPIPHGKRAYRLDAYHGQILSCKGNALSLSIECGDMAIYLVTDKTLPTDDLSPVWRQEVKKFIPISMRKFSVVEGGMKSEILPLPEALAHDISADVTYKAEVSLPEEPRKGEIYRLTLTDTKYYAKVHTEEETLGVFAFTPMVAFVDGGKLKKDMVLTVTVSNSASGEIAKKRALIEEHYPDYMKGPYAKRKMYALEARFSPPSLGSLIIEKCE